MRKIYGSTSSRMGSLASAVIALCVYGSACSSELQSNCASESDQGLCDRLSRNCDLLTAMDTCGRQRTVNCGTCAAPQSCGAGGTPNLCGVSAGSLIDSGVGSDATTNVLDAGPDACTFACPTRSHFVAATLDVKFATAYAKNPNNTTTLGKLAGTQGEKFDILLSFEEGATFKDPPAASSYVTRVLTSSFDLVSRGDVSGQFDATMGPALKFSRGVLRWSYSTGTTVSLDFGSVDPNYQLTFYCGAPSGTTRGEDQYVVPGPFSCEKGSFDIFHSTSSTNDRAYGDATFTFH
jgi:hypothetical protein